ncbi:MAG TPA: LuxR C-terminal-related transcriptional regulator, partial [Tepidiformaceae bacterium]|nr:LuxR C-terminal-related transcriptional regulator [Tepidiformaceae bacterium]
MESESSPGVRELLATEYAWTPRQRQVLGMVEAGKSNQEIADALGISLDGAKWHMREILSKLGVERREQAAEYWREHERWRRRAARVAEGLLLAPVARWLGAGAVAAVAIGAALLLVALFRDGGSSSAVEAELPAIDSQTAFGNDDQASPAFPATGDLGLLAFIRGGNVWVKPVPDGPDVQLTEDGNYHHPRWSPDGNWLIALRDKEVWLFSGTGRRTLLSTDSPCTKFADDLDCLRFYQSAAPVSQISGLLPGFGDRLSPDGTLLATSIDAGPPVGSPAALNDPDRAGKPGELIVIDLATGDERTLTVAQTPDGSFRILGWSTDGSYLTVGESPDRSASRLAGGLAFRAVDVATGRVTPLPGGLLYDDYIVPGPGAIATVSGGGREAWWGKHLAVVTFQRGGLPTSEEPAGVPEGSIASPAWSVDGSRLAYVVGPELEGLSGGEEVRQGLLLRRIYLHDLATGEVRQLVDENGYRDERPEWSMDGGYMLFARVDSSNAFSVWVASTGPDPSPRIVADELTSDPDTTWFGYYGHID